MDTKRLDELLAATEGHSDGKWDVSIGVDDCDGMGPRRDVLMLDPPSANRRVATRVDYRLLNAAPAFRTAVILLREELRRAQLLTPESVRAICEREGGVFDTDQWGNESWCFDKFQCCEDDNAGHGWVLLDYARCQIEDVPDPNAISGNLLTVGQLEDAIAAAKGAKDAS